MTDAVAWFLMVFLAGLAITVPAYVALMRAVARDDPDAFESLGRPHLLMGSPRRSIGLQRYMLEQSVRPSATPAIVTLSRFLVIVTPIYVVAVFWAIGRILIRTG